MKKALLYLSIPFLLWGAASCNNNGEYDASKAKHTTVLFKNGNRLDRVVYENSTQVQYVEHTGGHKNVYVWKFDGSHVIEQDVKKPRKEIITSFEGGADLEEVAERDDKTGVPNIGTLTKILDEQDGIVADLKRVKKKYDYIRQEQKTKEKDI